MIDLFTWFQVWNKFHVKFIMCNNVVQRCLTAWIMTRLFCFQLSSHGNYGRGGENKDKERQEKTAKPIKKQKPLFWSWSQVIRTLQLVFWRCSADVLSSSTVWWACWQNPGRERQHAGSIPMRYSETSSSLADCAPVSVLGKRGEIVNYCHKETMNLHEMA